MTSRIRFALPGIAALALAGTVTVAPSHGAPAGDELNLSRLGSVTTGAWDEGASEIVTYDAATQHAFVVNASAGTVDVLDISDASSPAKVGQLATPGANSVAVHDGLIAVAEQAENKQAPGFVKFFDSTSLDPVGEVTVGALPDMVTFTNNGRWVLVANEGEPSGYEPGDTDPEGSIAIIDLADGVANASVRLAGFETFNGQADELTAAGIRIFGPGATVAQDFEPEYIATDKKSKTAWVTLQENNAVAIVDIASATVSDVVPLGLKDHSRAENALDADDKDSVAELATWPVKGMYLPDSIDAFQTRGKTYLVTANEGDAREYDGFVEETRIKDLIEDGALDPSVFGDASLPGRLNVTTTSPKGANGYTELWSFGGRSISILDASGDQVWDSGKAIEEIVASVDPEGWQDGRSDNKGPEPEGVEIGKVGGRTIAFVGLERVNSIVMFDVTNPAAPSYAGYARTDADVGPEGLKFVAGEDSPTGSPLLLVGNEVSGTTSVWQIS